nr:MAG TPA: hypothetical protein [Caudoviricetes sp.]
MFYRWLRLYLQGYKEVKSAAYKRYFGHYIRHKLDFW